MWNAWCERMIGGRSESHLRDPGDSVMLVSGLVKLTKTDVGLLLVSNEGTKPFEGCRSLLTGWERGCGNMRTE